MWNLSTLSKYRRFEATSNIPKQLFVGFCRSLRGVNPNLVWGKFGVFWISELGGFWMTEKLLGFHETSPITANAGSSATQTYVVYLEDRDMVRCYSDVVVVTCCKQRTFVYTVNFHTCPWPAKANMYFATPSPLELSISRISELQAHAPPARTQWSPLWNDTHLKLISSPRKSYQNLNWK